MGRGRSGKRENRFSSKEVTISLGYAGNARRLRVQTDDPYLLGEDDVLGRYALQVAHNDPFEAEDIVGEIQTRVIKSFELTRAEAESIRDSGNGSDVIEMIDENFETRYFPKRMQIGGKTFVGDFVGDYSTRATKNSPYIWSFGLREIGAVTNRLKKTFYIVRQDKRTHETVRYTPGMARER